MAIWKYIDPRTGLDVEATSTVSMLSPGSDTLTSQGEAIASVTKYSGSAALTGNSLAGSGATPIAGSYVARIFILPTNVAVKILEVSRLDGGFVVQDVATAGATYNGMIDGLSITLPNPLPSAGATSVFRVSAAFDSLQNGTRMGGFESSVSEKILVLFSGSISAATCWIANATGYSSVCFTARITASSGGSNDGAFYCFRDYDTSNIGGTGWGAIGALWAGGNGVITTGAQTKFSKRYICC